MKAESHSSEPQKLSHHTLVFRSIKRASELFLLDNKPIPLVDEDIKTFYKSVKAAKEYGKIVEIVEKQKKQREQTKPSLHLEEHNFAKEGLEKNRTEKTPIQAPPIKMPAVSSSTGLTHHDLSLVPSNNNNTRTNDSSMALLPRLKASLMMRPKWHPPWKLYRVISGHSGWVRCADVEPGNDWFVTGAGDRIIKIWDLATGTLKLSLTGHVSSVRGVVVSARQPYLFSCGEDKMVKCWDLECNKVIRHYHGHLSACYCIALHPTIDVLITAGRDSTARVWDMRTKACVHTLDSHTNTVGSVFCQASDPQIVTGSYDSTIKLWDLAAGKCMSTLTHHKKSVRAVVPHPRLNMFASGSADAIKQWKLPSGEFIQNCASRDAIINALAVNQDDVLVSGGDDGSLKFWDWKSGNNFQKLTTSVQSGSIESEAGIFALTFDKSGTRLLSCEADKTIKLYKQDEFATEETHPVNWKPEILSTKRF